MAAASGSDDEEELGACGGGGNLRPGPSRDFSSYDDDDLEEVVVSASTKKSPGKPRKRLRPKCQYAEDCYRKNPHHFQAYCHPGDREWNERGPRPKARCPFGSFCNRKNARHQQFFHAPDDDADSGDHNNNKACSGGDSDGGRPRRVRSDLPPGAVNGGGEGDGIRPITDADFGAVRPKTTKNNYQGAKGSASKPTKNNSDAQAGPSDSPPTSPTSIPPVSDDFECGCCFTDFAVTESVACGEGHLFCQECLKNYVQTILHGAANSNMGCLGPDCDATFSTVDLGFIDPKLIRGVIERQQKEMLALAYGNSKDEKVHSCPFCQFTCLVHVAEQEFVCCQCQRRSCQFCGIDWKKHMDYGTNCNDVEADDEAKVRKKAEEAMTAALVRRCHRCQASILKESGCNLMTCRCGARMCYVCNQAINGYDHFCQHGNVLGQRQCPQCGKCTNVDDVVRLDAQKVEQERQKGEQERQQFGQKNRKKIGGNVG